MRIIHSVILAVAAVSCSASGPSAVQAAELYSYFSIEGTGTGSYQSTTNYPGETGYSTSGPASFSGYGDFFNGFIPNSSLSFQIQGLKNSVSVFGGSGTGSSDFTLTGDTFQGYAVDANIQANYSYVETDFKLTDLRYTISSSGGYTTYHFMSGKGLITYSQDIYEDEYNDDDTVTRYFVDATATINLTDVSGSYSVPSLVPLPASAPLFGTAVLALGLAGYGMRCKKAAAAA